MTGSIRLEDLPEAILHKIAQYLGTWERRTVLPLVSRGWARLLKGPSPAWEEITIAMNVEFVGDVKPDVSAIESWFSNRVGAVRTLRVMEADRLEHEDDDSGQQLPGSVLAAALGTHAHQLRVLHIDLAAISLSVAELTTLLGRTHGLEYLRLTSSDGTARGYVNGYVMRALSRLPALRELWVVQADTLGGASFLLMSQLSALSSPTLSSLYLELTIDGGDTLTFGALPALTTCQMVWQGSEFAVHVTASSFSGAPNLSHLELCNNDLYLALDCFTSLRFLTDLSLVDCGLQVVPSALAAVQHTLRLLTLSQNDCLQIEECGYSILLALSALKRLKMSGFRTGCTMPHWNARSVEYISRFPAEWQVLHPGFKPPTVISAW